MILASASISSSPTMYMGGPPYCSRASGRRGSRPADIGEEPLDLRFHRPQVLTPRHDPDDLVAGDLGLAEGPLGPPAVEEREGVADRIGVVDIVADEDHGEAAQPRLDDELQHHRRLVHPERRG